MAINLRKPEAFDRSRNFTVTRSLTVQGKVFPPGSRFEKTLVPTRRLRQLFDQRVIRMDPALGLASYLHDLDDQQLRDWLALRGVTPRFGMKRDKLLARAERVLVKDKAA